MKLTDRKKSLSGAEASDLIHIVKTGDTSQNSAGSSYKIEMSEYNDLFQNNFVRDLIIPVESLPLDYTEQDICDYINQLGFVIEDTDSKWNVLIVQVAS